MTEDLFIRQIEVGPMQNLAYLVGSRATGKAIAVDPSFDIEVIFAAARAAEMRIEAVIVTHAHADHVGGHLMGFNIPGVREFVDAHPVPVWVHPCDEEALEHLTGVDESLLRRIESDQTMSVGKQALRFLHTPGHSPGSVSILAGGHAITGDTMFVGACGRTDLPGGDPAALYDSLNVTLAGLPDDTVVFPGHGYGGRRSTIGEEKRTNYALRFGSREEWLRQMGVPASDVPY